MYFCSCIDGSIRWFLWCVVGGCGGVLGLFLCCFVFVCFALICFLVAVVCCALLWSVFYVALV